MPDLLDFKIATKKEEFEQIHKMNYETFVEEIPRYEPNSTSILVDKFHNDSTYIICISQGKILGMVSILRKRPFSLDKKLDNLDAYLPEASSICEVRLLAVKKGHRHRRILRGLLSKTIEYCLNAKYDLAIISGILQQQKLYKHIGFVPFGPVVGTPEARFQPMYLTPRAHARSKLVLIKSIGETDLSGKLSFMPGPVEISPAVQKASNEPAISHRSQEFMEIHKQTKQLLCRLVNAKHVKLLMGTGTVANDVIAGQLSLLGGEGLVLSNGEFGERLIDCASRFRLTFDTYSLEWGCGFNHDDIVKIINKNSSIKWLWAVHCETSTGMLNDMGILKSICQQENVLLIQDCVSSIGNTDVDLKDVHFASGVSGKGLRSYSGLSMVFYNHRLCPSDKILPAYLDLSTYAGKNGVPYTVNSNLVNALHTALQEFQTAESIQQISILSYWLRKELRDMGLNIIVGDEFSCLAVIAIEIPARFNSEDIGRELEHNGYSISYRSSYLLKRNWIQICLMGEYSRESLEPFLTVLRNILFLQSKNNS